MFGTLAKMYEEHVGDLYESYRSSKGFFSLDRMDRIT